jgi:hypothetical protein
LLAGEPGRVLSREFGVSETAIRKRFGSQTKTIKSVGDQLYTAEKRVRELPLGSQLMVRTFADDLHAMNLHMAGAGKFNAATAHRLSGIANGQVGKIDDANPMDTQEVLQSISALTKMSNEAALIPLGLIKSNNDLMRESNQEEVSKKPPVLDFAFDK